jgi:hypothetical protein
MTILPALAAPTNSKKKQRTKILNMLIFFIPPSLFASVAWGF